MSNYMAAVEYDGTYYSGFQIQPPDRRTIQGELEKGLSTVLQSLVKISYSGRTDAGVHAVNQVINFRTGKDIDLYKFAWSVNSLIPEDIVIKSIKKVDESFDARRDAKLREYAYYVVNGNWQSVFLKKYSILITKKLDLNMMKKAAGIFVGTHNFKSFCSNADGSSKNFVRKIFKFTIRKSRDNLVVFSVSANSFLYNMVRIIVGTILEVGSGERNLESVRKAITGEDRMLAGKIAPAKGLFLARVVY